MIGKSSSTTLAVLLERVKSELDALTTIVGDVQTGLSPFLAGEAPADAANTYQYAQDLDLLWQTLGSLSQVLDQAALDEGGCQAIDMDAIVGGVPLAALADRLKGLSPTGGASGDLDFF